MRYAIYPGSFNPWHEGHDDVLTKALACFDKVIIGFGVNPEKELPRESEARAKKLDTYLERKNGYGYPVIVETFSGLLVDFVKKHQGYDAADQHTCAVIRGLRNGHDLQYEMNQQYWNEDLGLQIPIVYFICDRKLSHISSSMMRLVNKMKNG